MIIKVEKILCTKNTTSVKLWKIKWEKKRPQANKFQGAKKNWQKNYTVIIHTEYFSM